MIKVASSLEKFLKGRGVYEKAVKYCEIRDKDILKKSLSDSRILNPKRIEYRWLAAMFNWHYTLEGYKYWEDISDDQIINKKS